LHFFANELSFNGEFDTLDSYFESLNSLMRMKNEAGKFSIEIHCSRDILNSNITSGKNFRQSLSFLTKEQRISIIKWITQDGPFFEDSRSHDSDDYFDLETEVVVTDTSIGEAAFLQINEKPSSILSLLQPHWEAESIRVTWQRDEGSISVDLPNYVNLEIFTEYLKTLPKQIESWVQLEDVCKSQCTSLSIDDNAFDSLKGVPFVKGAALTILERVLVLDKLKSCFDQEGKRTEEGQRIYQDHFTGSTAWFSDSSTTEKEDFSSELTFKHSSNAGEELFCPYHGKIQTPQLRVHHSWPVTSDSPLYVMYVGPKLTKR
jgi:hypothetical protein